MKAITDSRSGRLELLEHVDRKIVSIRLAIPAGPKAIHLIALDTVIKGPPERSRTGSPRCNAAKGGLCIGGVGGADSEKAATDKGILSIIPSISAVAIDARFVNANMFELHLSAAEIDSNFVDATKLNYKKRLT